MATKRTIKNNSVKAGPYLKTKRAKKMPGKSVAIGGMIVLKKPGKPKISFKKGALREQLNVPEGKKISASKKSSALAGKYGPLAKKRAIFAFKTVLAEGRKTLAEKPKKPRGRVNFKIYTSDKM